ncbi:hypothetical protein DXG03_006927 [Asterophora parasitica]|uniref:Nitrogen regulatory protein areA GATA-like domain-containing protein n=1 Tax=Asterophora parasitica TaxID=117018 RepID=A0A9P7G7U2_9AGAR|nr:hypothetical protein DXG03_006927 [Asterophora parasitica]
MSPTFEFPVPVLSVAADAVRELEGGEALSGLWTRESSYSLSVLVASLKDGHRLENISWRLWYREMAAVPKRDSDKTGWDDHRLFDEKAGVKFSLERKGNADLETLQTLPPTTGHPASLLLVRIPVPCHLPTPSGNEDRVAADASRPEPPLVHVQIAEPSTPPSTLPRLVVVNPTPGPTPHPTPPATPVMEGLALKHDHDSAAHHAAELEPETFTLLPMPLPTSPLFVHASTSSSSSSGSSARTAISSFSVSTAVSAAARKHESSPTPTTNTTTTSPTSMATATTAVAVAVAVAVAPMTKTVASPPRVQPVRRTTGFAGSGHLSPDAAGASHAGPSRPRTRASGHIRQTSSTSSGGGGGKNTGSTGGQRESRSKSKSRSRSRGGDVGAGLAGLTMTLAAAGVGVTTKKGTVVAGRGRTLSAMRRTGSARGGMVGRIGREKRPTFNIGSHSDEGSAVGSKSGGSGSSMSGPGVPPQQDEPKTNGGGIGGAKPPPPTNAPAPTRLLPPAQHHIPDPGTALPPQQPRRTIVLATTDSDDYETETDTESESDDGRRVQGGVEEEDGGDTGEWSSEDMSTDDVEVVVRRGAQQQQTNGSGNGTRHAPATTTNHVAQHATTARRTHSQQHTTTTNAHHPHAQQQPHLSRAQQSRREHAAHAQYVVEQAALETQRIREMFAKKPVPSSEQLVGKRTRSVGLLSQLMNPDPQIFPPTHPYRRGYSSGEIKGAGLAMTQASQTTNRANAAASSSGAVNGRGSKAQPARQGQGQQRRSSSGIAPGLQQSKSSAAIPVASQVQVGSVARVSGASNGGPSLVQASSGGASGGYRPKGRPADQEMEDETDTEGEENARDAILLSKSVAQEKLKALARKRGIVPNEKPAAAPRDEEEEPVPEWARESKSTQRTPRHYASPINGAPPFSRPQHQQEPHPAPAAIPVGHPYNLPPPAAPSTPRTTRRLMLQTEMSESLRRNLLWERQVTKVNLLGFRRTASGGGGAGGGGVGGAGRGGTVLGGGLRPLTALPSMVQLTAKQPGQNSGRHEERERERRGSGGAVETEQEKEERKKRALARNRSWTNDYHYSGW